MQHGSNCDPKEPEYSDYCWSSETCKVQVFINIMKNFSNIKMKIYQKKVQPAKLFHKKFNPSDQGFIFFFQKINKVLFSEILGKILGF